ncbi:hypothetical protein BB559_007070 [Furculomyces boomerangus]|uniref:Peptidase A1 domain-containing protein n=2 Tax=Harpellales TaxID=61421 RepID=A0A2T9XZ48_9FUNG|nr:hypothetical protein BB559_007070 [Furculomyces boomerangus]PWA00258.1 hypothetical protein BB558_003712 [Smittium angustum]
MNLGIAAPSQNMVALEGKNKISNEFLKGTDDEDQKNGGIDIDMINGDKGYYVELGVGTPPQYLRFHIDINNDYSWIVSNECRNCFFDQQSRRTFNGANSESREVGNGFVLRKPGSFLGGNLSKDIVRLNPENSENVEFVEIDLSSIPLDPNIIYDGLIGIGYPKADSSEQRGYNGALIEKYLKNKILSINLKPGVEKFSLGYQNKQKTTRETIWISPTKQNPFKFDSDIVTIGQNEFRFQQKVIVNPKYQKIYLPSEQFDFIKNSIQNSENCKDINSLPALTISVGDKFLTLEPKDYITFKDGICESDIEEVDGEIFCPENIVLGQIFLQKYVVTLDYGNHKIGFSE